MNFQDNRRWRFRRFKSAVAAKSLLILQIRPWIWTQYLQKHRFRHLTVYVWWIFKITAAGGFGDSNRRLWSNRCSFCKSDLRYELSTYKNIGLDTSQYIYDESLSKPPPAVLAVKIGGWGINRCPAKNCVLGFEFQTPKNIGLTPL